MSELVVSATIKERVGEGPRDTLLPKRLTLTKNFGVVVLVLQLFLLLAFAVLSDAPSTAEPASPQLYDYYVGVALMMLVGFGYLMTFLRWYGLGAVGLTMLVTTLGAQVSLLLYVDLWLQPWTSTG
jgi:hypothetical protein